MASKFIILVAFASLVQVSRAVSWEAAYGLSIPQQTVLVQISSDQEEAILKKHAANKPFYDVLEQVAAELILNEEPDSEDILAELGSGVDSTKAVTDFFLDTISVAIGESCSAAEDARAPLHTISDDLFTLFRELFALMLSGDYYENESLFDEAHTVVLEKDVQFNELIFDALRTCLNTDDESLLDVIKSAQNESDRSLTNAVNSLLNAMKTIATALSAGDADAILLMKIRGFRRQAFTVLTADIDYKAVVLKTIFVQKSVDYSGLIDDLYEILKTESISFHKFNDASDIIFGTITDFLIDDGKLYDDGDDGFTATVAAEALANANYKAAAKVLVDSLLAVQPDASEAVASVSKRLSAIMNGMSAGFFKAIRIVQAGSSDQFETNSDLEEVKENLESVVRKNVEIILDMIYNGQLSDSPTDYELAIPDAAIVSILRYIDYVFDAITILAEAGDPSDTSGYGFEDIEYDESSARNEIHSHVWTTSIARAIVLWNARED